MNKLVKYGIAIALTFTTFFGASLASNNNDENAHAASIYSSCKAFNSKYPHGVRVSSKTKDTVHKRNGSNVYKTSRATVSKEIYKKAVKYNSDLDRDKDNIACEK
ncbi:excalibur calcium-binding domain-containing protein [Rummeliibacillus pycnus]|uniref:excalibur calcium-binding domain-containing protein n=1 Tax=Rummeliibacillus pycnus TaxID=101070 RepID=UPI003D265969